MPSLILIVFAFVLAVIAASGLAEPHRTRLIAAALAFFFAACIFGNQVVSGLLNKG